MNLSKADRIKALELASKYGLEVKEVELMIKSPYDFIKEKTKELDFSEYLTKEEFDKLKTNFNLPAIGKLYASHHAHEVITRNKLKKNLDNKK